MAYDHRTFMEVAIHESGHVIIGEMLGAKYSSIVLETGQPGRVYGSLDAMPLGDQAIVAAVGPAAQARFVRRDPFPMISRVDLALIESAAAAAGVTADQFASFVRDTVDAANRIVWRPGIWRRIVAGAEAIGEAGGRICFTETAPRQPTVSPRAARMQKAMEMVWGDGKIYP